MFSHVSGSIACWLLALRHHGPPALAVFCALFEGDLHLSLHSAHCGVPKPSNFHNAVGVQSGGGGQGKHDSIQIPLEAL
ncbi:4-hydroxybenzoate octaprenyltransferase [Dissostichus eleginoides]|uniref:4-hydroxybenzoate octaprenyltransferase n=1 Tax=Dissostichus eleginoides TaxID=100907 RepID=A0AAD9CE46_DISEL|nr:4-hydroxybenzoate octaprenyltransferase [Dissostichus eleginoides]